MTWIIFCLETNKELYQYSHVLAHKLHMQSTQKLGKFGAFFFLIFGQNNQL